MVNWLTIKRSNGPHRIANFRYISELWPAKQFSYAFNQKSFLLVSADWYKLSVDEFTDDFERIERWKTGGNFCSCGFFLEYRIWGQIWPSPYLQVYYGLGPLMPGEKGKPLKPLEFAKILLTSNALVLLKILSKWKILFVSKKYDPEDSGKKQFFWRHAWNVTDVRNFCK